MRDWLGKPYSVLTAGGGATWAGTRRNLCSAVVAGKPVFSADSRRVAYLARNTQDLWFAVVDGVEKSDKHPSVKGHPGVFPNLLFSLDGRRLAYVVSVDTGGTAKQLVVVDRQEGGKDDETAWVAMCHS